MKRWLLVALAACGAPNANPIVLDAPRCAVARKPIEGDIAAGELLRAGRRLAIDAARCPTDPWIGKTKGELARALETNESGDALLAKGTPGDRDRALVRFERSEHAAATVGVVSFDGEADRTPAYSSSGAYVVLGTRVVDVRAGRVVASVGHDDEIAFSPDEKELAVSTHDALRVVALPSGGEILRHPFTTSFVAWSEDGAWLAWSGDHAGWAELASKRVQVLGNGSFRGTPAIGRGVVAAPTDAGGLVVKRLSSGDPVVATLAPVESFAIDRKADRILFLETSKGPLRELDLATGKTRKLAWKSPRYAGMCGEDAGWRIVALDKDTIHLTRDCSGVDNATLDLKTARATFGTIADGEDLVPLEEEWGHDDKSAWEGIDDVDFTTYDRVVRAPKRDTFAGFDRSGRARVWTKAGKIVWAGPAHAEHVIAEALTPDGGELLTFSHAYDLRRWNVKTGALVATRRFSRDCVFHDLVVRDDGEAVISCTAGDDTDRFYRERAKDPVLDRKRRDVLEKAALDRRGAFAVFSTLGKPTLVAALEPNTKPIERPLPDPKRTLAAAAGDFVILTAINGDRDVYRWSTGALLASIPGEAPNHYRTWVGFANRGAWLAAERSASFDLWSIDGERATLVASLARSPASPWSFAVAGSRGPFVVRGSMELATWSSADDKPSIRPSYGESRSIEWATARDAFVFAEIAGVTFRSASGERSLDLLAVPDGGAFVAIDAIGHAVTRGGDRRLAADLLECRVGTRTFPYEVCAGRFDAL